MFRTFLLVLTVGVMYVAAEVELYPDKYDFIDIAEILANDRLREQYYACFINTGPCLTPDAKFFKGYLPEGFVTKCLRCTKKQQQMFSDIVEWYTGNQPEKWNVLVSKLLEDATKMKIAAA